MPEESATPNPAELAHALVRFGLLAGAVLALASCGAGTPGARVSERGRLDHPGIVEHART